MDDKVEDLRKEVDSLEGPQLLLRGREKISDLLTHARNLRKSHPEESLKLMTTLAMKSLAFPDTWREWKKEILRETINLIEQSEGQDYVFALKFADLCKAEGQYTAAGYNYKRAAEAFERRKGISYLKFDPPRGSDQTEFFVFLSEATTCFQMGGESALARTMLP